ncbi:MAG: indole-3-glycerol phosphate synthase TrpC [Planctomycetaceae bacterium]|nr:MAG: indole-3-glycerol phosphate synthase TrpC [Planctomycetaceae bacterium]
MADILEQIMARKRDEIVAAKAARPESELKARLAAAPPPRDFVAALRAPGPVRVIAEVKKASPSAGVIRPDFDPVRIAREYERAGAACLSVLTDEHFFQGRLEYLTAVRQATSIPVLRKDFLLDCYQVLEARVAGADCVLLIAECLDDCRLRELYFYTSELGMAALIELYDEQNLDRVLKLEPELVGVNNRNLRSFQTDLAHSIELSRRVPGECVFVSESGIHTRADVARLEQAGIRAILVGESLMRSSDIGASLHELIGESPA